MRGELEFVAAHIMDSRAVADAVGGPGRAREIARDGRQVGARIDAGGRRTQPIVAARAVGDTDWIILRRHILPNSLSPLIIVATTQVAGAIMAEAALSFLGLGMPVTKPSLGTLIRSGYDLMFAGSWWVTVLPGLVLIAVLISINVLGDGLRDWLDPRRGQG